LAQATSHQGSVLHRRIALFSVMNISADVLALGEGARVLVVASDEDFIAARLSMERQGATVLKRASSLLDAVVCAPSEAVLSASMYSRVAQYRAQGRRILDLISSGPVDGPKGGVRKRAGSRSTKPFPSLSSSSRAIARSANAGVTEGCGHRVPSSRKRRALETASASAEKRCAPWQSSCSQATRDRIDRALEQRMYLVSQENTSESTDKPERTFTVLGSTGNVYNVVIGSMVTCSCPDAMKGNVCKHQLFVFLRVFRLPASSPLIYQKALLAHERADLFTFSCKPQRSAWAKASIRNAYAEATGCSPQKRGRKKAGKDDELLCRNAATDDCVICFEKLGKEELKVCKSCQNAVHDDCFQKWAKAQGSKVTCPHCRDASIARDLKRHTSDEGYLNLGAEAGLPSERDESTYYSRRCY